MIRALFVTTVLLLYIFIVGLPMLLVAFVTRNTDPLYRVGVAGARLGLWLAGIEVEVHGRENIPYGRAAIYMPNHQSNSDPPVIIAQLPPVLVMLKEEFLQVPVLGTAMRYRGFIPIDRKNRERAIAAVEKGVESLAAGNSFLGFPEGTRSRDGRLLTFKKGLFVMAIKAGVLVVPVSISGGRKIMPKGKLALHPGRVRVTIHEPISAANFSIERRQELIAQTREAILKGLEPEEWPREV